MTHTPGQYSVVIVDDEAPALQLLRYLLAKEPDFKIVAEASSGQAALKEIRRCNPDLVLLDIQMPRIDGFEVVRQLGASVPYVIFVTAYHEYAIKAFEVHALDYVLKPPIPERFAASIERARQALAGRGQRTHHRRLNELLRDIELSDATTESRPPQKAGHIQQFTIRDRQGIRVVAADRIEWIESADHFAYAHIGTERFLLEKSLAEIDRVVDPNQFVRIRRNAIVNLAAVVSVHGGRFGALDIRLKSGREFSTSRKLPTQIRRLLIMHCRIVHM